MIDDRTKMMIDTVRKLYHREAFHNIQRIFVKTHTADVAEVIASFQPEDRLALFKIEPSLEKRAAILSYLPEEQQTELVNLLDRQDLLKLVPLMDTDDAADMLGRVDEELSRDILSSVQRETSEEVTDLMAYPEDSAGGLMSSEYLGLNQDLTVQEAIQAIQDKDADTTIPFYIYVIDDNEKLVGVLSLKQLLLSRKTDQIKELMYTDVVTVSLNTSQEDVAKTVERYDFLALPVVDSNFQLMGVITVDDVIDVIREEAEEDLLAMGQAGWGVDVKTFEHLKARLPWLLLSFIGGVFCFYVVYEFSYFEEMKIVDFMALVAAFIPLLLSVGGTVGSQAATVAVGAIRTGKFEVKKFVDQIQKELRLALIFAIVFGGLVFWLGEVFFSQYGLSIMMASALCVQIFISMLLGVVTPVFFEKAGFDPTVASVPVYAAVADVSAIVVLFSLLHLT